MSRKEIMRRYYLRHKDEVRDRVRAYTKRNPDKVKIWKKRTHLKQKFGLTLEAYQSLLESQNYCCKICGIHRNDCDQDFAVDHSHQDGRIRGLLCTACNWLISFANERIEVLANAIQYLR